MGRKKLRSIDWSSSEYFACPFVSHEDTEKYYCLLCHVDISGTEALDGHVSGQEHETNIDRYGHHISPLENDFYMCSACDCTIPYYTNVYRHINAKRHQYAVHLSGKKKEVEGAKNSVTSETNEIDYRNKYNRSSKVETNGSSDHDGRNSSANNTLEDAAHYNFGDDTSSAQDSGSEEIHSVSTLTPSGKIANPEEAQNLSPLKTYSQRLVDLLNFRRDIYDLRDRAIETELGMDLCLKTESGRIYCLICRIIVANTLDNYFEHLCSLDHCKYLEEVLKSSANCGELAGRFSEFDLTEQYMGCASEAVINCLVCNIQVQNIDRSIQNHIDTDIHREKREEMRATMRRSFRVISSRLQCDWYKVQKYSCIPCSAKFGSELKFAEHLETENHAEALKRAKNSERGLIYDFCATCALLWYGYRGTYTSHCDSGLHKWYSRNGGFVSAELPESAQYFLAKWGTQNEDAIDYIDFVCTKEENSNKILVEDLGNRVKLIFPCARVCAFGTRISSHCIIDVFIGCEKMNDGRTLTDDQILYFMTTVNNWLSDDPQSWDLKPPLKGRRSPIINANHKPTGLTCDISFDNGLMIGGRQFIESFDDIFPSWSKLMHYLTQWLAHCELTGSQHISSYVLYWCLIFYLQKESILPSVAALTNEAETEIIGGHQVDGRNSFAYKNTDSNVRLKQLVIGFCNFYASFDFRHDVACPFVGEVVKKRSFAYPENLPIEMGFYVAHVKYSNNPKEFPIDSAMCIQDPFNLNHNLSETVSKVDLSNFRTYCRKTADFLCSS